MKNCFFIFTVQNLHQDSWTQDTLILPTTMNLGVSADYFALPQVVAGAAGSGMGSGPGPGLSFLQSEMNRFDNLRRADPDRCRHMFASGAELVLACKQGQVSKLRRMLGQLPKEDLLIYCKYHQLLSTYVAYSHFTDLPAISQLLSKCSKKVW
jgi:hypothetical protein